MSTQQELERQLEAMEAERDNWRSLAIQTHGDVARELDEYMGRFHASSKTRSELRAERDRYKAALERIRRFPYSNDEACCVADEALKGEGE